VWAKSAEGHYWALGDSPKRSGKIDSQGENNIVPFNQVRSQDAQRRIKEARSRLEQLGQLPSTAGARVKAITEQGISSKTLYRHPKLWHPIHDEPDHSKSCKTSQPEEVSAIREKDLKSHPKTAKPSHSKKFYTSGSSMKCRVCFSQLIESGFWMATPLVSDPDFKSFSVLPSRINSPIPNLDEHPCRFSLSETVTSLDPTKWMKLPLIKDLKNQTVTIHQFTPLDIQDRLSIVACLFPGVADVGLVGSDQSDKVCDRCLLINSQPAPQSIFFTPLHSVTKESLGEHGMP